MHAFNFCARDFGFDFLVFAFGDEPTTAGIVRPLTDGVAADDAGALGSPPTATPLPNVVGVLPQPMFSVAA